MLGEVDLSVVSIVLLGLQIDVHLLQEMVKRLHQVVYKIELIVVHGRRHDYRRRSLHECLQPLRVLQTYQLVPLAVHEESRTLDIRHDVNVAEAVVDQVLQRASGLLPHDISDRHERTH